jgi:hypothetical protein
MRSVGWALMVGLGACKAESVGVVVPRGGPASLRMEDLQRDLARVGRSPDAFAEVGARLAEMHFDPAFAGSFRGEREEVCGLRRGALPAREVEVVGDPRSVGGQATLAAGISLAKGLDIPGNTQQIRLCLRSTPTVQPVDIQVVDLGGSGVVVEEADGMTRIRGAEPAPAVAAAIDLEGLLVQVREVLDRGGLSP